MAIAADTAPDALREERLNRRLARIARTEGTLNVLALGFVPPLLRAAAGDAPAANLRQAGRIVGIPLVSILLFLLVWAWLACVETWSRQPIRPRPPRPSCGGGPSSRIGAVSSI